MKIERYLVVSGTERSAWVDCSGVRVTKAKPKLNANERAIKLYLNIPDALFKRPELECRITIPEDRVSPAIIDCETVNNIQEAISQQLGVDLKIELVEPKEEV